MGMDMEDVTSPASMDPLEELILEQQMAKNLSYVTDGPNAGGSSSNNPNPSGGKLLSFLNPFRRKRDSTTGDPSQPQQPSSSSHGSKSTHEEHTMLNSKVSWVNIEESDVTRRHSLGGVNPN